MLTKASHAARSHLGRTAARRGLSSGGSYTLPSLDYDYGELAPAVSAEIMELHHSKHHNTYVANLNASLEKHAAAEAAGDVATMVALQPAIKFNGGGHVNHSIFWTNLAPPSKGGGGEPEGDLAAAIDKKWGSFAAMQAEMGATTAAIQGSGWGWLSYDPAAKDLAIVTCANQDPCSTTGTVPLLGIDIWARDPPTPRLCRCRAAAPSHQHLVLSDHRACRQSSAVAARCRRCRCCRCSALVRR